jgi:tripartite-type tricarboxylate transporter receptor subunit TctC
MLRPLAFILCSLAATLLAPVAIGQSGYPNKPIKIIAPVQPGGGVDLVARQIGDRLSKALGQPVIVDNQSGGGGVVGSLATARAAPDGYTLMVGYVGTHGTNPAVRKLPYDASRISRRSQWSAARRTCSSSRRRFRRRRLRSSSRT